MLYATTYYIVCIFKIRYPLLQTYNVLINSIIEYDTAFSLYILNSTLRR